MLIIFDREQMASLSFTVSSAGVNALPFSGTNFIFSGLMNHGEKECKRHDLALEKLQRKRDEWNKNRMKRVGFMCKRLREKNEARAYINNVDEAMLEYYCIFAKKPKKTPAT